jgi:hypothetical protein
MMIIGCDLHTRYQQVAMGLAHPCTITTMAASPFAVFEGACPEPGRRVSTTNVPLGQ